MKIWTANFRRNGRWFGLVHFEFLMLGSVGLVWFGVNVKCSEVFRSVTSGGQVRQAVCLFLMRCLIKG